jgi:hypothetical protein
MSCYVPLRSIEARPGSPSSTSTLAHPDEAHFGCLHHHSFILSEAVPDHLTKFPDGVDVAALRKSLHHPFTLPDLVPDRLTELPARGASRKQHHDAFTIRGSVPDYSIESPAHMDIEASLKQQHHHTFTLPDPVPDHLTEFPAHVDVEALHKQYHVLATRRSQTTMQPNHPTHTERERQLSKLLNRSPLVANNGREGTITVSDYRTSKLHRPIVGFRRKLKQAELLQKHKRLEPFARG